MTFLRTRFVQAAEGHPLLGVASWATCAVFAWILFWVVVDPVAPPWRSSRSVDLALAALLVVALVALAVVARPLVDVLERRTTVRRVAGIAALVGLFLAQVRLGLAVRFPPGWDAGQVETWAHGMAHGYHTTADWEWMINLYPNNSLLISLLTRWFELGDAVGVEGLATGVVLINALVMTASVGMGYAVARRVAGPTAGYVVAILAAPLIGVSPWIGVAYSDTLGMIFPITIIYLHLRLRDARRLLTRSAGWLAIGFVGYLGYCIKPTVLFVVLSVVAVSVVCSSWRDWTRPTLTRRLVAGAALAGGLAAAVMGVGIVNDGVGVAPEGAETEQAMPFTHFLMMGAQKSNGMYGGYSADDVEENAGLPPEQRFRNGLDGYAERVSEMGPVGYAEFLHDKSNWVFGDGTFTAFGEGEMSVAPTPWARQDPLSRSIRDWFSPHAENFAVLTSMWQVSWLAILALVVLPVAWWRSGIFSPATTAMRLSLLGLLIFLLLFEARSRYLYLYLPVFMVLAAATVVMVARPRAGAAPRRAERCEA